MKYTLSFRRLAVNDIDSAAAYCDEEQPGLGDRFRDEFAQLLRTIEVNPLLYPRAAGTPFHKAVFDVFPFATYYRVERSKVIVIAVHGCRRDPAIWMKRS